jgi:hypothetical protein
VLVGHGIIERQVLGPAVPGAKPEQSVLVLRRYRCRGCRAIVVVGPRGLIRRRWYGAGAMALALSVYARGETSVAARARTSPSRAVGASAVERWVTLVRWIDAARRGELFGVAGLGEFGRRRVAEHVVLVLAARAGHELGADLADSAFDGAAIAV